MHSRLELCFEIKYSNDRGAKKLQHAATACVSFSAYDHEKEHQWRQLERKLRVQIAQLEAAVKSDVAEKDQVLGKMADERGKWSSQERQFWLFEIVVMLLSCQQYVDLQIMSRGRWKSPG